MVTQTFKAYPAPKPEDYTIGWLPGEQLKLEHHNNKWIQRYGAHGEYQTTYSSEPVWSRTNRAVAGFLGDSAEAWATYRLVMRCQAIDQNEIERSVSSILQRVRDPSVAGALFKAFECRLADEGQSSRWSGASGVLCNMVQIYGAAVCNLQLRFTL